MFLTKAKTMKIDFDKFYTPFDVAKKCIKEIDDIDEYDVIVEPSAGSGNFSSQLNCIAFDIEPEGEKIIKQDFLQVKKIEGNNKLFIGNPPFGVRSSLAKEFIKHSIELGAETIAFVLPNTFNKFLVQKVFPNQWKLKKIIPLDCEYKANGIEYFVPSSFFIWTLKDCADLRKKEAKKINDFIFLSRGDETADFVLNGNSGKIKSLDKITNPKAEHYIKSLIDKEELIKRLNSIKWIMYSSVNGGNAWISQKDIEEQYGELKLDQNS